MNHRGGNPWEGDAECAPDGMLYRVTSKGFWLGPFKMSLGRCLTVTSRTYSPAALAEVEMTRANASKASASKLIETFRPSENGNPSAYILNSRPVLQMVTGNCYD